MPRNGFLPKEANLHYLADCISTASLARPNGLPPTAELVVMMKAFKQVARDAAVFPGFYFLLSAKIASCFLPVLCL